FPANQPLLWQLLSENLSEKTKIPRKFLPPGESSLRGTRVLPGGLFSMPHFPKPFFRKPRNCWYVQIDGKQHNLGSDKEEAYRQYHRLMSQGGNEPRPDPPRPVTEHLLVICILDSYLDWLKKQVAQGSKATRTFEWYSTFLKSFSSSIPDPQIFTVDQ